MPSTFVMIVYVYILLIRSCGDCLKMRKAARAAGGVDCREQPLGFLDYINYIIVLIVHNDLLSGFNKAYTTTKRATIVIRM